MYRIRDFLGGCDRDAIHADHQHRYNLVVHHHVIWGLLKRHRGAGIGKGTLLLGKDLLSCLSPRLGRRTKWDERALLHEDRAP